MKFREYFNKMAENWDENVAEKDTLKLEQMIDRLDVNPGSTVLDVGTGTGVFLPFILSKIGLRGKIVALDFAEEMLKKAEAKNFNGYIDYLCADVTNLPVEGGRFDMVICYSSFPHFQDKPGVLAEMWRVIKESGRLIICHTASRATINEIHRQVPLFKDDIIPDRDEMELMLSAAGFVDLKIEEDDQSYFCSVRKPDLSERR